MRGNRLIQNSWTIAAIASLLIAGCGGGGPDDAPELYGVTGTIKYNGQPVPGAKVMFLGDGSAPPAVGVTNSSGEFVLSSLAGTGAAAGKHAVVVVKNSESATSQPALTMEEAAEAAQNPPSESTETSLIPSKYGSAATSDLSFEVSSTGANHYDIVLTD